MMLGWAYLVAAAVSAAAGQAAKEEPRLLEYSDYYYDLYYGDYSYDAPGEEAAGKVFYSSQCARKLRRDDAALRARTFRHK
jgi:hypothetical protein